MVVIVVVVILVVVIAVTILKGGAFTPFKMQSGETETDPYCQFLDPDIFSQKLTLRMVTTCLPNPCGGP